VRWGILPAVRRVLLWLVMVVCFLSTASSAGSAVVRPWVTSEGTRFVNQSGATVLLRGVDVQLNGDAAMVSRVQAMHANLVRILLPWSVVEPAPPSGGVHRYSASVLATLDRQLALYAAAHVNVIIDLHQWHWSSFFQPLANGIPTWFYSRTEAGRFRPQDQLQATAAWWTDPVARQYYTAFATMIAGRYASKPNVVGVEIMNEPMVGALGNTHAATQAVITWQAVLRAAIARTAPAQTVFVMLRSGGDLGLLHADFAQFGSRAHVAIDLHSYLNGLWGTSVTKDDEAWNPSWTATHNQTSATYHGTATNQAAALDLPLTRANQLSVPLLVGEWGVKAADSGGTTYQSQMLALFRQHGLSWARWGMWTAGDYRILNTDGSLNPLGTQIAAALKNPAG
jgi:hypothetical protein